MHKINISYWKDVRIRNTEEKKRKRSPVGTREGITHHSAGDPLHFTETGALGLFAY